MKLRAIRVSDVKGFGAPGKAIEGLGDGLNVLAAENEFGKSTLFEALRVVLYEKHSFRNARTEALRPYHAKGGPTVEVDLETAAGRFRLHKRFLSKSTATVLDLATGQAIASGDDVQDWVFDLLGADKPDNGPTGLLWVEQGTSLDQPKATKTSGALLSSLIEETVSEVTGGTKVRKVLSRASGELKLLVTEKNKQPTGRYRDALKARKELIAQIDDCETRLQKAEATRQDLSRLQDELAHLEDQQRIGEQQRELKAVTETWQSAQHVRARLEGLSSEVRLTEQAVLRAGKDLEDLEKVLDQAGTNSDATQQISRKIGAQEDTLKKYNHLREAAIAREEKQKTSLQDAKATYELARKAAKSRRVQARLQEVRAKLHAADDVQAALSKAIGRRDAIKVDRQALERLDTLRAAAERADARLKAGRAKVTVLYAKDGENKVRVDGHALGEKEEHGVDGRLVLDVDTVGRIIVDAGAGTELATARQQAKASQDGLQTALSALGVNSMTEARDALAEKTQAEAEAKAVEAELHRIAPIGLQNLKDEYAELSAQTGLHAEVALPKLGEEEAESNVRAGENALDTCRKERAEAEQDLRAGEQVMSGYRAELERLRQILDTVRQRFGDETTWQPKQRELIATLTTHKEELANKTAEKSTLQQQVAGYEALTAKKARLEEAAQQHASRILELKHQTGALVGALGEIDKDGVGEKLAEAKGALVRQDAEVTTLESEKRALELLIATLKAVEANVQAQFFEPVMAELKPLLHEVMPESELKLGSNFSPDHIVRDGLEEPFAHLSGGTREQIAVLTRLAFARLMARKGRRMPVILDDALVYSDDARIERMFKALQLAATDIQLIVLTCRQKTFQDLGGRKLQLVDWQQT